MRDHPLTPMRDANLVRVLGRQTKGKVELVPLAIVRQGTAAVRAAFADLASKGVAYAIVDAVEDNDLLILDEAAADLALITGGSGAAIGLPENYRRAGLIPTRDKVEALPAAGGLGAVIAGSCSVATLGQVEAMRSKYPVRSIDPLKLAAGTEREVGAALTWAASELVKGPVLIHASAAPEAVAETQKALGRERAGALVEEALASIAEGLVKAGVRRLVVAGGETSGAVVQRLGVKSLRIGPQIDPGVPAVFAPGKPPLAMALKSGNFGARDFFTKALEELR